MSEAIKENKMGVMSIKKLLFTMSVPMVISMLVQALYNIVDSVYVSQLSDYALTSVSLAYPLQYLMNCIITGTAVGAGTLLSKSLGAKDFDTANKTANVNVFLAVAYAFIFAIIGILFSETFFSFQTDIAEIVSGGKQYLTICMAASFGMLLEVTFERLLQATGKTMYSTISQFSGAIINIILDPILIFGMLGFPAMGVSGAAIATVIGQISAAFLALMFNLKFNKEIKLKIKEMVPNVDVIKKIYSIGFPNMVQMSATSIMNFLMNNILMQFTYTAVTVFGIYVKLQSFAFMPSFGLATGMCPIVAYNYGAKNRGRVIEVFKTCLISSAILMLCGTVIFNVFPGQLLNIFDTTEEIVELGVNALRTASLSFVFVGICTTCNGFFVSLGKPLNSLILSMLRNVILLVPYAYLLSLTGNVNMVWLAFVCAEATAVLIVFFLAKKIIKEKLNF